ncbi:MAG: hypothetical protein KDD99_12455, partial [Bacteroidetes bacterium]|nr:hypothetical protein [Bacteroidota bacterium]
MKALSATKIDSHSGSTKMGCFIISIHVTATVTLYEREDNTFYLNVQYAYSGSKSGSGAINPDVSGNFKGCKEVSKNVEVCVEIENWNLTSSDISFDLTASISHTSTPKLGPDYIFKNQRFAGSLAHI